MTQPIYRKREEKIFTSKQDYQAVTKLQYQTIHFGIRYSMKHKHQDNLWDTVTIKRKKHQIFVSS